MKKRILIIILVILIMLLIGVLSFKLFYGEKAVDNEIEDWGNDWAIDYENISHGIFVGDEHIYGDLIIENATFRAFEYGRYTFVADVKNNGTKEIYHSLLEIEFLDKDEKVLFTNYFAVEKLAPSDTAYALSIIGDTTRDMRKFANYRVSNLRQMD